MRKPGSPRNLNKTIESTLLESSIVMNSREGKYGAYPYLPSSFLYADTTVLYVLIQICSFTASNSLIMLKLWLLGTWPDSRLAACTGRYRNQNACQQYNCHHSLYHIFPIFHFEFSFLVLNVMHLPNVPSLPAEYPEPSPFVPISQNASYRIPFGTLPFYIPIICDFGQNV